MFRVYPDLGTQFILRLGTAPSQYPCFGIRVEKILLVTGKHQLTKINAWFLASWENRLNWERSSRSVSDQIGSCPLFRGANRKNVTAKKRVRHSLINNIPPPTRH
jgi:hypothetical protein